MNSGKNLVMEYYRLSHPQKLSTLRRTGLAAGMVLCVTALIFLATIHVPVEERYRPIAQKYAAPVGMETDLVLAVVGVESRAKRFAVSPKGATGLMQLLPSTAQEIADKNGITLYSRSDLFDPDINIHLGVLYLSGLLKRYNGDVILALGAYNAGPRRVKDWRKKYPKLGSAELCDKAFFKETRAYVSAVLRRRSALIRMRGGTP